MRNIVNIVNKLEYCQYKLNNKNVYIYIYGYMEISCGRDNEKPLVFLFIGLFVDFIDITYVPS